MAATEVTSEWMTTYVGRPLDVVLKAWCLDHSEGPIIIYADDRNQLAIYRSAEQSTFHWAAVFHNDATIAAIAASATNSGLFNLALLHPAPGGGNHVNAFLGLDPAKINSWNHWLECGVSNFWPERSSRVSFAASQNGDGELLVYDDTNAVIASQGYTDHGTTVKPLGPMKYVYSRNTGAAWDPLEGGSDVRTIPGSILWTPDIYHTPMKLISGYFYVYNLNNTTYLRHLSPESGNTQAISTPGKLQSVTYIPVGANSERDIFVGTDQGLYRIASYQWNSPGVTQPQLLFRGNVSSLRVNSLDANSSIIWLLNRFTAGQHGTLGYINFNRSNSSTSSLIPIGQGDFAAVSPSMSLHGDLQRILYCNSAGKPFLLERNTDMIWLSQELGITPQATTELYEEVSFVTHVKFAAATRGHEGNRGVQISSSSSVSVRVNGQLFQLDADKPVTLQTDAMGRLEIINPSLGLASPRYTLTAVSGDTKPALLLPAVIDPAASALKKLSDVKDVKGLVALNIFTPNTEAALTPIWEVIKNIRAHMETLPPSGSAKPKPPNAEPTHGWDWMQTVRTVLHEVESIKFDEAEQLVVKFASETWKFLVSTFEQAWHGLETIFKKAGADLKEIQSWLGYIFSWEDVVKTQKSLSAVVNVLLDCDSHLMDSGIGLMNRALDNAKTHFIANPNPQTTDPSMDKSNSEADLKEVQKPAAGSNNDSKDMSHPAIDYLLNRIENLWGQVETPVTGVTGINAELWTNTIPNLIKGIEGDIDKIKTDLADIFSAGRTKTVRQAISALGSDVLTALVDIFKSILAAMAESLKAVMLSLGNCVKKEYSAPFLSSLFQHATKTTNVPSVLDLMMFVVAIPTTVLNKLTGVSMPTITYDKLKSDLFPHPARALFFSGDSAAWDLYMKLYHSCLKDMTESIPNLSAAIYAILLVPQFTTNCLRKDGSAPDGFRKVDTNGFAAWGLSLLQIVLQASYIPIMDSWDSVYLPEVRFAYWGADCFCTLYDVYCNFASKVIGGEKSVKWVVGVGGAVAFGFMAGIAIAEFSNKKDSWTDKQKLNADKIAGWTLVESLFYAGNRIGSPWCPEIEDPETKSIAVVSVFVSGVAAAGSSVLRNRFTVELGNDAPPGPVTSGG